MISLIIISFNQQEQLRRTLPRWLAQQDTRFEVCVVDLNSKDDTLPMLEDIEEQYPNLRHISLPRTSHGIDKDRLAVMLGIRTAEWDRVIIMRPCVLPPTTQWVSEIVDTWSPHKPILLIHGNSGKPLSLSRRLALFMARYGHARRALCPAIGYTKTYFMTSGGFPGKTHKRLSAIDALVCYYSKSDNTQIITDAEHSLHCLVP